MDARASRSLNVYAPAIPGGDRAATQQLCDRLKMAKRGQVAMKVPLLPSGTISTRSPQASPPEPVLYVHPTSFQYSGGADPSAPGGIAAVYRDLVDDPIRTQQVVDDVMTALSSGRHCLVLTQWTRHLEQIAAGLTEGGHDPVVLRGGMGAKARAATLSRLDVEPDGGPLLVVATGSYIGEGFDCPLLDTLFLAAPIAFKGASCNTPGASYGPTRGSPRRRFMTITTSPWESWRHR